MGVIGLYCWRTSQIWSQMGGDVQAVLASCKQDFQHSHTFYAKKLLNFNLDSWYELPAWKNTTHCWLFSNKLGWTLQIKKPSVLKVGGSSPAPTSWSKMDALKKLMTASEHIYSIYIFFYLTLSQERYLFWVVGWRGAPSHLMLWRQPIMLRSCSTPTPRARKCSSWSQSTALKFRWDWMFKWTGTHVFLIKRFSFNNRSGFLFRWQTKSTLRLMQSWEKPSVWSLKTMTWRAAAWFKR